MKKTDTRDADKEKADDLLREYDFDYSQARPNRFASHPPSDQIMVTLDPDVAAVFTTAESVNKALRALITAIPTMEAPKSFHKRPSNR
jgi:hypothetical protein